MKLLRIIFTLIIIALLFIIVTALPNLDYLSEDDCRDCHGDENNKTVSLHHNTTLFEECKSCHMDLPPEDEFRHCDNCHIDFDHHEGAEGQCAKCHEDKQNQHSMSAFWKFDENTGTTVLDSSGNGNTGTIYGSSTWTAGKVGSALQFDGIDDYVDVGSTLNFEGNFTILMWAKRDADSSSWSTLISKGESDLAKDHNYVLYFNPANELEFAIGDGTDYSIFKTTDIYDTNWHHLAVEFVSVNDMRIYVDGAQQSGTYNPDGIATVPAANSKKTLIGASSTTAKFFTGIIDEVKIYNKVLTEEEIIADYSGQSPSITSFDPVSPVNDTEGDSRTFNITVDQTVNITWYLNGMEVKEKEIGVTQSSYNNTSASNGTWNVEAIATNDNGTVSNEWIWNVTAKSVAPSITSFDPVSPVNDTEGDSRTFNITVDQTVNVTWYLDDVEVKEKEIGVTQSSYNNTSASNGTWNVEAIATNDNGTVSNEWIWNVTAKSVAPSITGFDPVSPVNDTEGDSRTFNITVDQTVNVTWYLDDVEVKEKEIGVTQSSYNNTSASNGTWNVEAIATNDNGTVSNEWIWNVTAKSVAPSITGFDPVSPVNDTEGDSRTFNITVDQTVNVTWYLDDVEVKEKEIGVTQSSYNNTSASNGTWNVEAIATNDNGTVSNEWIWNVTAKSVAPSITGFDPVSPVNDTEGDSRTFNITVDQTVNVTWYLDDVEVKEKEIGVTQSSYNNTSASNGTWNVEAIATNDNGTVSNEWIWNVTAKSVAPSITGFDPVSPVNDTEGDSRTFNITVDQTVNVTWYLDDVEVKEKEIGVTQSSYNNTSASNGTWNVEAIATNDNGTVSNEWIWNVTAKSVAPSITGFDPVSPVNDTEGDSRTFNITVDQTVNVTWYLDDVEVKEKEIGVTQSSYNNTSASNGTWNVEAIATNDNGTVSNEWIWNVTAKSVAPSITGFDPVSPVNDTEGDSRTFNITVDQTVNVTWYLDDVEVKEKEIGVTQSSYNNTSASNGTWNVEAIATNDNGTVSNEWIWNVTAKSVAPSITGFDPVSPVNDTEGDSRTFNITVDQTVNVTWYLDDVEVKEKEIGVTQSSYNNTSASNGTWNVEAIATNDNGTVSNEWIWNVTAKSVAPSITGFDPVSPVNDTEGDSRTFNITVDQTVNVTWYLDDVEVKEKEIGVTQSSYNNTSASNGTWNVEAIATNDNGTVSNEWIWNVTAKSVAPSITGFDPVSPVNDTEGESRTFNITVDQTVNVTWYLDDVEVKEKEIGVTQSSYNNTSASNGTWNVEAIATNDNGTVSNEWIWNVTVKSVAPSITSFDPESPVDDTEGDSRTFNITVDHPVNVTWYLNDVEVKEKEIGVTQSSYNNTSASTGTWNVEAIASNANGAVSNEWIWNVTAKSVAPSITGFDPVSPVNDTEGESRTFNITVDQTVNVTWYLDDVEVKEKEIFVTQSSYNNTSASTGTWNVEAIATNDNGTVSNEWIWNVTVKSVAPSITSFDPESPVDDTEGDSRTFNITVDHPVNVTWYLNDVEVKEKEIGVTQSSYTNTSASTGTWNVEAIASNANGAVSNEWIWNVTAKSVAPSITGFDPVSPVDDTEGESRTFNITVDQPVNVTWYLDDVEVKEKEIGVTQSSYTNTSASTGTWNVEAIASNANGTVSNEWIWNVTAKSVAPSITGFDPESPVDDTEGDSRTFNITVDQTVNVTWYLDDVEVKEKEIGVTQSSYTNTSASTGTWNVEAIASNANGAVSNEWIWNVTAKSVAPSITSFDPESPVDDTEGESRTFNITVDHPVNVTWYLDDVEVKEKEIGVTQSSYTNTSASTGTWNVEAIASNANGAVSNEWIWNVTAKSVAPSITSFDPESPVDDTEGESRTFNITVDHPVNVTWYLDDVEVKEKEIGVTQSSYTNTSASTGTWNVEAIASNANGAVSNEWIWNVTAKSVAPSITSFDPESPVDDTEGESRTFNITVDQPVNVTWYLDDVEVKEKEIGVTQSSYTNTSASTGTWNVEAIASNANGAVSNEWTWNVTAKSVAPSITSFDPESPVNDTEGESRTFNITVDQPVNVTWYLDDVEVKEKEIGVIQSSYTNTSASTGTWNVEAIATNDNGAVSNEWIWNVTAKSVAKSVAPSITGFDPESPVNDTEGQSRTFNITVDQPVNVTWYLDDVEVKEKEIGVIQSSYTNTSASTGTWNVEAIATNDNGTVSNEWIWNVAALPPSITSFDPESPVNDTEGDSRTFSITVDQNVNVEWYRNGDLVKNDEMGVTSAAYEVDSALPGTWNIKAIATNDNGDVSNEWIWNVAALPPSITSFDPESPVDDTEGDSRTFSITVDQNVNVEWYHNGDLVKNDEMGVTSAAYEVDSALPGTWNIKAIASNDNGDVSNEWIWNVAALPPSITSFDPESPVDDTEGDSRTFSITVDQNVNVEWYHNGDLVKNDEMGVTSAAYEVDSALPGTWNIKAIASNDNGDVSNEWIWNVAALPPSITSFDPESPVDDTEGDSRTFSITVDQNVNVEWYHNGDLVKNDEMGVTSAAYEVDSALPGTWNIKAIASNDNGDVSNEWIWNVAALPPSITSFDPESPVDDTEGDSRTFSITVDQNVNVEWYHNGDLVKNDEMGVTSAAYEVDSALPGTWNIKAIASNDNGDVSNEWIWNVAALPPSITSFDPESPVDDTEGDSRTFSITVDQNVNVEWYHNGDLVKNDEMGVTSAAYEVDSALPGTWNIKAIASNDNGDVSNEWIWNVAALPPSITSFDPESPVDDTEGDSRTFSITVDQNVNVEWYHNGDLVKNDEMGVTSAAYEVDSALPGTWNIKAIASNDNGDVSNEWIWNVAALPPSITSFDPESPVDDTEGDSRTFSITVDQNVNVEWYHNGDLVKNDEMGVTSAAYEVDSALPGTWNIKAIASNDNGDVSNEWIWNVAALPPSITSFDPESPVDDTEGDSRTFSITVDQNVNVEWYHNGDLVKNDEMGVTSAAYEVDSALPGTWNIKAIASNDNGDVSNEWIWNVAALPPSITSFDPESPVDDTEGDSRTFSITVDQNVNVEWYHNGDLVKNDEMGVTSAAYEVDSALPGTWNIKAIASNDNGDVSNEWIWNVAALPPSITSFDPESPVDDTEGDSRTFSITVDQNVNVEWYHNGDLVKNDEMGVTSAAYEVDSALPGTWNIKAIASNDNGDVSNEWIWNVAALPPSSGLSAYWKFDENTDMAISNTSRNCNTSTTVSDSSGNGHTGTVYGSTWTMGNIGLALQFDGVNDYVDVGSNLNFEENFTVLMWAKRDAGDSIWRTLISKGESILGCDHNYLLCFSPTNELVFAIGDGTNYRIFKTINSYDTNWHHLAVEFVSSTDMRIYVDGVLQNGTYDPNGIATTPTANLEKTLIGASSTNDEFFKGVIDEVKIYNKVLTEQQIIADYSGQP